MAAQRHKTGPSHNATASGSGQATPYPCQVTLTKFRTAAASSLAAAGLLVSLAACSTPAPTSPSASTPAAETSSAAASEPCAGVQVIVDSSALKQGGKESAPVCVPVDGPTPASEVLAEAKVETVGTTAYPTEVVCRVNGVPAADVDIEHKGGTYREECKDMTAAFAYWSLWVKPAAGEWGYAQEGLATLQVNPGESLELLYTVDGEPAAPKA